MAHRRVVIVGLHGGGPCYMNPLAARGRLPVWQRLAARGLSGDLAATWPVAGGSWVTLLTGLDVAQHGVIDHGAIDARRFPSTGTARLDSTSYADDTLLSLASAAGRTVASIGTLMTAPAFPVNGVLVPGLPVADEVHPATWPPDLGARLGAMNVCPRDDLDPADPATCRRYLDYDLEHTLDVGRRLYHEREWDLFMLVFGVPDMVNHVLCQNPAVADWRAIVDEYHERTDAALGAIVDTIDGDSVVMVVSGNGSCPAPPWSFRVSTWLEREGLLARRHGLLAGASRLDTMYRAYRAVVGSHRIRRLRARLPRAVDNRFRSVGRHWAFVDIAKTRVYPVEICYPLAGFEVNLRGRNQHGVVPEGEYEQVRDSLVAGLSALRRPDRDAPLCRGVYRREEVFDGPFADRLPDVVAELDPEVEAELHFGSGVFAANPGRPSYPFRGYHAQEGVMLVHGPGIDAGRRACGAHVRDVMPTVLRLLDVPIPPDRRGRYLPDLARP